MPTTRKIAEPEILGKSVWVGNCQDEVFAGDCDPAEVQRAAALWNDLDADAYLRDGGKYRERRYAEMKYDVASGALTHLGETDFYQSNTYNTVNSGTRRFSLIDESFLRGKLLQTILKHFASRFAAVLQAPSLELFLHQVRIIAEPGGTGLPTPEGIHKDGVDFSCQVLFGRQNVAGGESIIYSNEKEELLAATMLNPLDFYCFKDPDIYHSVTPIQSADGTARGTRDILGIEFCVKRERSSGQ
jgi:hypothetical protein